MEYVVPAKVFTNGGTDWFLVTPSGIVPCPSWILSIDLTQVGWTRAGKLVAYDYANN